MAKHHVFGFMTLALAGGCIFGGGGDDDGGGDATQQAIDQYEALRLQLEAGREEVLPAAKVDGVQAGGPWLTWLDMSQGYAGVLHARRFPDGAETVSDVGIGDERSPPNYVVSESLAMTARFDGGDSVYSVIGLGTGSLLDEVTYPKPQAAKYDAYAVYGEQAYIVREAEGLSILEWTPGKDEPAVIGAVDASLVGAFIAFAVMEDDTGTRRLIAVGTTGTSVIDLGAMQGAQLPLPVLFREGALGERGVVALSDKELWFVAWGASEARAIHDEIVASGYTLNKSFPVAHEVGSDFGNQDVALEGSKIYYRSNSGVFAFDIDSKAVTPVLLDDMTYSGGLFVTYTGLVSGDAGLFVVGLESDNGATGADGPVYRVAL